MANVKGLRERLRDGESVVVAEGYMRELERRGYLQYGPNTPEIVLTNPEVVRALHEEFVMAGSDVVQAFTYYGHRSKLSTIGRESDLERLNRSALRLARGVATRTGTLMAAGLCNSCIYDPDDVTTHRQCEAMFKEQILWAVEEGADYVIAETFSDYGEAVLALDAIKKWGNGLAAVVTMTMYAKGVTTDGVEMEVALRGLEARGADVVGLNCARGPATMLPLLRRARAACQGPLAALPVLFRTTDKEPTFQSLTDPLTGCSSHPLDIDCNRCTRAEVSEFAKEAKDIGVQYIGLCCGSSSNMLREVAMQYGKTPPAAQYAPAMDYCVLAQAATTHVLKRQFFAFARVYNLPA